MEDGHPSAEAANERHVVLYDDNGAVLGEIEDQFGGFLSLAVRHAGDRLENLTVFENLELSLSDSRTTLGDPVCTPDHGHSDRIGATLARIGLTEQSGQPAGA